MLLLCFFIVHWEGLALTAGHMPELLCQLSYILFFLVSDIS
jgi:hypothetical protein